MAENEVLIKSKKRVQQHGEVFTPRAIVDAMVTLPGLAESILQATTTVLEPSVGEGAFLINILERRLKLLAEQFSDDLVRFENYSLLALSSLYGIELLEDNVKKCAINLFTCYHDFYSAFAANLKKKTKSDVEESAKTIVVANILQGDFLKRKTATGEPIFFSEWAPLGLTSKTKHIKIIRSEHSLDEIYLEAGEKAPAYSGDQLNLFLSSEKASDQRPATYLACKITEVHKGEREVFTR